jgi:hypothetical protein
MNFTVLLQATGEGWSHEKQKAPAFMDRNARALEMSSASSWRLYPERSITPHSICGSGRLFMEFKRAKRRVDSDMAKLFIGG